MRRDIDRRRRLPEVTRFRRDIFYDTHGKKELFFMGRKSARKTSPKKGKPKMTDRLMGYLEETAMNRGLMPVRVYMDGRTWKHGSPRSSPVRPKRDVPNTRDRIMGYFEEMAMNRGIIPVGIYVDGRTWKYGQPAPYVKRRKSKRK